MENLDLLTEFKKLSNLSTRYVKQHNVKHKKTIVTRSQSMILEYIADKTRSGEVYQKDIEKHFSIRRPTASEALKKLEDKQLITRTVSNKDARLKNITLTPPAKELMKTMYSKIKQVGSIITEGITLEELAVLKTIIIKMQNNLIKEQKNEKNTKKL